MVHLYGNNLDLIRIDPWSGQWYGDNLDATAQYFWNVYDGMYGMAPLLWISLGYDRMHLICGNDLGRMTPSSGDDHDKTPYRFQNDSDGMAPCGPGN